MRSGLVLQCPLLVYDDVLLNRNMPSPEAAVVGERSRTNVLGVLGILRESLCQWLLFTIIRCLAMPSLR